MGLPIYYDYGRVPFLYYILPFFDPYCCGNLLFIPGTLICRWLKCQWRYSNLLRQEKVIRCLPFMLFGSVLSSPYTRFANGSVITSKLTGRNGVKLFVES